MKRVRARYIQQYSRGRLLTYAYIGDTYVGLFPYKEEAMQAVKKFRKEQRLKTQPSKKEEKRMLEWTTKFEDAKERQFGMHEISKPLTYYEAWPTCCGAAIIHGFSDDGRIKSIPYKEKVRMSLRAQKEKAVNSRVGALYAIINYAQMSDGAGAALEDEGFVLVDGVTNPNHDNRTRIYLYTYHMPSAKEILAKEKRETPFSAIRESIRSQFAAVSVR